ncbi:YqcC family protein [Aliagarivorans marinus]|uniref:YqcC family protein n=1 Tax=Aliagarivorans marinus TaxID=561965 RepID=UPI0003FE3A90|nr:YqcC family protein [Aliagarivorans marinus]
MPTAIRLQIRAIEAELKRLQLWQPMPPSAQALESVAPFCVDTLSFPQWLQFVLIPRMDAILDSGQALPSKVAIHPYAEEALKHSEVDVSELLALILSFDRSFAGE